MIKSIFRAHYETRNFMFEGFGLTREQAIHACNDALILHAREWNLARGWCDFREVECNEFTLGVPYREQQAMT